MGNFVRNDSAELTDGFNVVWLIFIDFQFDLALFLAMLR